MTTAERNRSIKAIISKAFAGYKVSVTGSRGTGHGWVDLKIGYSPRNSDEQRELKAHVMQLLAAANAGADGSSVSEPMRRALVKSVSAQMTTEDPQRLLDFSSVLLAALQPGSSRNRTVVKVIYKVSKTSANDSLFAARPRLLQLMAEVVQASSDLDAVL